MCMISQFSLGDPMDCSLPVSSVHGILPARIVEWVAMPSSGGSSWPRDWTLVSLVPCISRQILYWGATGEAPSWCVLPGLCKPKGWLLHSTEFGVLCVAVIATVAAGKWGSQRLTLGVPRLLLSPSPLLLPLSLSSDPPALSAVSSLLSPSLGTSD